VYFICYAKTFRVERAKLELHMSSDLLDVGVFEVCDEQAWVIQLLLDIVCGPGHESVGSNWRAAYSDVFSDLEYVTCLKEHAHLYAMAARLGMYELRDHACEMFKADSQIKNTQSKIMCDAVIAIYTEIEDTLLKKIIVDAWLLGGKQLAKAIGNDGFIRLVALAPEFVADLHARMINGLRSADSSDRFRILCDECGYRGRGKSDGEVGRPCCENCGSTSTRCDLVARVRLNHLPVVKRREK